MCCVETVDMYLSVTGDSYSIMSNKYSIKGIPTLLLFHNGEVLANKVGFISKQELISFLDEHLK